MISTLQGRIASSKHEIREIIELEKITISQNLTKWVILELMIETARENYRHIYRGSYYSKRD